LKRRTDLSKYLKGWVFEISTYREVMHGQELLIRHYITKFIKYLRDAIYIPFKLQWGERVLVLEWTTRSQCIWKQCNRSKYTQYS